MGQGHNGLFLGIGLSLFIHFAAVGVAYKWSQGRSGAPIKLDSVTAVLVRKGKPRPKHLLPRIHQAPRPVKVRKRIVPKRRPKVRKRRMSFAEAQRRMEEKLKRYRRKRNDEDDPRADRTAPPGVKNGSDLGTVSTLEQARMGSMYGAKLRARIESVLNIPPFFNEAQTQQFKGRIKIVMYINSSGRLIKASISTSSGDSRFDNAVLSAVRRGSPYPAPPAKLAGLIRQGIEVGW